MMKNLLYKQIRLVSHPMTFVFILFGCMTLIPNYPYTVGFFYVMLGLFFTFMNGREQKDNYYSAILPIPKRDTVKASFLFVAMVELLTLIFTVPCIFLSAKINPNGGNMVGVDANLTLLGDGFLLFTLFNAIFLPAFYKSAYKVGTAFVVAIIPTSLLMIAMEAIVHFPAFTWLDGYDYMRQWPVLLVGAVVYFASIPLIFKSAAKAYDKVDL
jgi:hypothetical protein